MRIHESYTKLDRTLPTTTGRAQPPAGGAAADVSVKLSPEALALSGGSSRVAELRAKVQNGGLRIDAEAIAKKLVGGDE